MATEVQEMRNKLRMVREERAKFAASFGPDNIPNEDDERKLDAMMNGEADLEAEIKRLERFESAAGGAGQRNADERPNPAKVATKALKTFGAHFVESEQFKVALASAAPTGKLADRSKFPMDPIAFKGLTELGIGQMNAALFTGGDSTSAGAFVIADRFPELVTLGRQPIRILDLIRILQTSSDLVEYVAQTSRTNNADTVAEATATGDDSGVKPESAAAFVVRNAPVVTIANWIPVTRQAVADVPQIRGIIDTELRDNLRETLADKVVNGTGGTDITGILQTSGRQTQSFSTNILTTTRKAKTIVRTVGRAIPEAYVLNPADWETIDLLQDNEARYFYGGPAQVGTPRLWGLPVAEEEAVASGTGIVGQFTKAILWDREAAQIYVSDSHADFFIRNLLAILAELRAAFALTQPTAIVEIDLTS